MRIGIIGGGIGGLTAALALLRAGLAAEVYEQAPELLEVGAAIAVWPNAVRVLRRLGLGEAVAARSGRIERVRWVQSDGRVYNQFSLPAGDAPALALHRADLQGTLLRALPGGAVRLGKTFQSFAPEGGRVRASFSDGTDESFDVLVGADGLRSRVRGQLAGDGPPVYRGYAVWRGITSLEGAPLEPHSALEVYGVGRRFGVGPVGLGRTGWWATSNEPEGEAEAPGARREKLLRLFGDWCAPVPELIRATETKNILRNAAYDRPPLRRWGEGNVTLLGDAAHPMTPNLGQGGCMALEDAALLARCLSKHGDPARALRTYESRRRVRTARLVSYSRLYGAAGQAEGAAARRLRTAFLSSIPETLGRKLLRLVFDYDAEAAEI